MIFEVWMAFLFANLIMTAIPGPSIMLIIGVSLNYGFKMALLGVIAVVFSGILLIIISLIGVGAILSTSPLLFVAIKWAGVLYMAFLGVSEIRRVRNQKLSNQEYVKKSPQKIFSSVFFVSLLNPKAMVFYLAFLSQFLSAEAPLLTQSIIIALTASGVIFFVLTAYALMARQAKAYFNSENSQKNFGYIGGSFLIGASVLLAVRN